MARRWWPPAAPLLLLALLLATACGRAGDGDVRVIVDGTAQPAASAPAATATPTLEPVPFTPTPPPSSLDAEDLRGFDYPVEGACLPDSDRLMPNAPREYRNGVHEGIDFYDLSSCARVAEGTAVLAMYGGVVVRADRDYQDITPRQVADLADRTARQGFTDAETLDVYRGRQVWIDHGNGVVTRYAHLGAIEPGVAVGVDVSRGQAIAAVGESGTPESITDPGTEMHAHVELRIGQSFLGDGLSPGEVRALYERLFAVADEPAEQ